VLTYLWNPSSPAWRLFGHGPGGDAAGSAEENRVLGTFARAVIRARPGRYAALVATDFVRFFVPGVGSRGYSDNAIRLPDDAGDVLVDTRVRDRFLPGYAQQVRTGAGALRAYSDIMHTPRWGMGLLALAGLAAAALGGAHRREVVLLVGAALLLLLGSAATSEMVVRYLVPCVPLLVAGGALALRDLLARVRPG